MNFFDTQAGHNFAMYTVPKLVDTMESLVGELKKTNEPLLAVLTQVQEEKKIFEMVLNFAKKNLSNPIFLKQLKSLWTSYCICKGYEVDTLSYDRDLADVWNILVENESNPFVEFEKFDNYMCEDLV